MEKRTSEDIMKCADAVAVAARALQEAVAALRIAADSFPHDHPLRVHADVIRRLVYADTATVCLEGLTWGDGCSWYANAVMRVIIAGEGT